MPEVRPATAGDIDGICRLLHEQMNAKISEQRWRRLMDYPWLETKPDLGRVVDDAGRIVGFVGMVYSDRWLEGQHPERIVNICAWYLDRRYRGRGLGVALMRSATKDDSMSYHILTSSAKTLHILDAVGYRVMDDARYWWKRSGSQHPALPIITDPMQLEARLPVDHARLLADHAGLQVTPVLLAGRRGDTLLLFSVVKKGADTTFYDLLYVSNPAGFLRHAQAVADQVLPAARSVLAADCRFFHGHEVRAERVPIKVPRFLKSTRLAPSQIDNLYSEIPLLDLKL